MSTVETDVVLDADGNPVFRAFDQIEARMKRIQGQVDSILVRAKAAAEAFGGSNLKTVRDLEKVMSTLEKFESRIQKNSPVAQGDTSWAQRKKQLEDEARLQRKLADEKDKAYADIARKEEVRLEKLRRQEESDAARALRTRMSQEEKLQRLEEQRYATARANEARLERERDQARAKEQRAASQIRPKTMREDMRQEVENAKTVRDLENQRLLAANRLHEARQRLGKGTVEEDRALHSIIAQERERLRLAEAAVRAEVQPGSNTRIDRALDVRSGKYSEQANAATIQNLNAAKSRQAELQRQINQHIARTRTLEGEEKKDAENLLKIDEARLNVIKARVRQLETEARQQAQAAQRDEARRIKEERDANRPPKETGKGGGGGLFGTLGTVIARTAMYGGAAAAIYGTISALHDGVAAAVEFEDEIAKISAVAGLTATQGDKLAASIREVAANSRFATNEIAEATMVMAQAGFSASDIGNSLQQVANLATAAGVGIGDAVEVATGAIGAFQLQTSETGNIADILTAALNTTKLNIQQVALGIQYAGATAFENKMSFDELTASMATMAQAGIKSGSTIGTGLRQFLVDLQTPTKKMADEFKKLGISMEDIDVKTLGLPEVLRRLSDAGFSSASAYGTMETRAAAAYLVLKNNQPLLNEQIVLQNQLGSSAEAAAKGSESLSAEWQRFKNQTNETVAKNLTPLLDWFQEVLRASNELNSDGALNKMRQDLAKLQEGSSAWKEQVNAIHDYEVSLAGAIEAEGAHAAQLEAAKTKVNEANDAYDEAITTIDATSGAIQRLVQREEVLKNEKSALAAETASLMNRFGALAGQLLGLADTYDNLLAAMRRVRAESISLGALRASEQYMGLRDQNTAERGNANSLASYIVRRGIKDKAPPQVRDAIESLARNQNGQNSGELTTFLFNWADKNLKGGDRRAMMNWSRSMSRIGQSNVALTKAQTNVDVMTHLGSKKGQDLLKQVDEMSKMSPEKQKSFLANLEANAFDPHNSASKRGAYEFLAQQATTQMGSGQPPQAPAEKEKKARKDRSAERKEREGDRRNAALARMRMKATEAELEQSLKGLMDLGGSSTLGPDGAVITTRNKTLTSDQFKKNLERVDKSLDKWIDDRTKQVEAEIDSQNMGGEEAELMRAELRREIKAKQEDTSRKVSDGIVEMLKLQVDAIMQVKEDAEAAADQALALADARVQALSRSSMRGKVPDYVADTYQRSADRAKDDNDRTKVEINDRAIAALNEQLKQAREELAMAEFMDFADKAGVARKEVEDLERQVRDLTNANTTLKTSLDPESLMPQSFNDQLKMAIDNYREVNNLNASWTDMIGMNLTDAIGTAHGALEQFMTDAISGTGGIMGAWKNMTRSLISYLQKLLIKMIAVKAMQMALSMFGSSAGGAAETGDAMMGDILGGGDGWGGAFGISGNFYGGHIKGALRGEHIRDGVPGRDSVLRRLAKGEFVVRKSAVDSVGVGFMNRLNQRGAMAMQAMGPKIVMPPPAHQEMAVYVVAQDEKPQLRPQDVLVVVQNDIVNGGPTKQLIKHVSQGG